MQLLTTKNPHFFSINSVQNRTGPKILKWFSARIRSKFNKIWYSRDPVQSRTSPMLSSAARMLSEKLMSCRAGGTNECLDLRRRSSALDGRVSAEWRYPIQSPWHGVLETVTVWLHRDEAQQVGCLRGLEGCPLVQDAGIQSQFARRRWWQMRRVWAMRHQTGA